MHNDLVINWMSHDPITITPEAGITDAENLLYEYDIRRLPVVNHNGDLIGIVTLSDVRQALASETTSLSVQEVKYLESKLKVNDVMTPDPITIYTNDTIASASRLMLENRISGLPVVDPVDDALVGIITESDIFRLMVQSWDEKEPGDSRAMLSS